MKNHIIKYGILLFAMTMGLSCSTIEEPLVDNNIHNDGDLIAKGCEGAIYPNWLSSPYVLPYPVGQAYKVDLSTCSGSFHSKGNPDAFAVDFNMKIGEYITASRDGIVVEVEESGLDYGFPNNVVVIEEEGGTFAQYMHLTRDGALIEEGDIVSKGDTIGISGATGLAGYPHLHFVVTKSDWPYPYVSVPHTFSNTDANERGLKSGRVYKAMAY